MRGLEAAFVTAQRLMSIDAQVKVDLTRTGQPPQTYTRTRIKEVDHTEEPHRQSAQFILHNADRALNGLDLKGFKAVISWGVSTYYSACAPLWVAHQQYFSSPGRLTCELSLAGIPNLLAEDRASGDYTPTASDTKTIKTLITEIAGATLSVYSHCTAYTVIYDSEDSIINTFQPKDSFRITIRQTRLEKIKELISYTGCVMRVQADGNIHIFVPVTTGTTYDYVYDDIPGLGYHTFFSKALRYALVVPNKETVKSRPDEAVSYTGTATHADFSLLPIEDFHRLTVTSNAQALAIAQAILSQKALLAQTGSGGVPMNCGQEIYDYIKITDRRQQDTKVGNVGFLRRTYRAEEPKAWLMQLAFGRVDLGGLLGTALPGLAGKGGEGGEPGIPGVPGYPIEMRLEDIYNSLTSLYTYLNNLSETLNQTLNYIMTLITQINEQLTALTNTVSELITVINEILRWKTFSMVGTLINPTVAINVIRWQCSFRCRVLAVKGYRIGGTGATVNARKEGTALHLATDLSLTSADVWMESAFPVQNQEYYVGDKMEMMLVSVTGSPTQVAIQVDFERV